MSKQKYKNFYIDQREKLHAYDFKKETGKNHGRYPELFSFVNKFNLFKKKFLEIGSSIGALQNIVQDYTGTDVAENLKKHYTKPYYVVEDDKLPFEDETFEVVFTFDTYEHIINLDQMMDEMIRVVKPGGYILFQPAWQCRSWHADGYPVRPYSDFNILGKLIKFSILLRERKVYRFIKLFPKRVIRHLFFILGFKPNKLNYISIKANYDHFWMSDSDACNSIDGHDAILWFKNKNFKCINYPNTITQLFFISKTLIFKKD